LPEDDNLQGPVLIANHLAGVKKKTGIIR